MDECELSQINNTTVLQVVTSSIGQNSIFESDALTHTVGEETIYRCYSANHYQTAHSSCLVIIRRCFVGESTDNIQYSKKQKDNHDSIYNGYPAHVFKFNFWSVHIQTVAFGEGT